jgi:hypothetical protein
MSKDGSKISKVCGVKKINHYNKADCVAELKRLETSFKNKDGLAIPDTSKYYRQVQERLTELS